MSVLAPAAFTVDTTKTNNPVAGETFEVTVAVENTGDVEDTQTITTDAAGGTESKDVTIDGDDSTTEAFELPTDESDAGHVTVTSNDEEDTTTIDIAAPQTGDNGTSGSGDGGVGNDGGGIQQCVRTVEVVFIISAGAIVPSSVGANYI